MRIQHNIPAMNSYRNYTANNKSVAKNLEKLSSGYRINRAGDDAAGLAISEKMRAQITGLKAAQKNAKDGISLVQTAEGALTEVHSMLNRMVELADQSANGTYDNDTDRMNLQKEIEQLKSEIDRIADSTNFNGIKLLDGSLGGSSSTSGAAGKLALSDMIKASGAAGFTGATAGKTEIVFDASTGGAKDDTYTLKLADKDGAFYEFTVKLDGTDIKDLDGNVVGSAASANKPDATELSDAFKAMIDKNKTLSDQFTVSSATGTLTLESKVKGAAGSSIEMSGLTSSATASDGKIKSSTITKGEEGYDTFDVAAFIGTNGLNTNGWDMDSDVDAKDALIEINGQKFAIVKDDASAAELVKQLGKDVNIVKYDTNASTTADALTSLINAKTGLAATEDGAGVISLKAGADTTTGGVGGLRLQIGDTSESFNQLTVSIGDMHTSSLGIKGVNISTQEGAAAAIDVLKNAINSVSSTRGDLGATQNRLDHTINNLSVMTENIQDAEASIRDVDVAEEMMAYTKNNILVQSSQAMLAQANQLPQGVLQLLQ